MSGSRGPARCRRLVGIGAAAVLLLTGCTGEPSGRAEVSTTPVPAGLTTMADQTPAVIELVRHREWGAAGAVVQRIESAWTTVHDWDQRPGVGRALHRLGVAVDRRDVRQASRAALDAQQRTLDLESAYLPAAEVDVERFRLEASRLEFDVDEANLAAVRDDAATLSRLRGEISGALPEARSTEVNQALEVLQDAVADGDLGRIRAASERLAEGW